jgi:hypothetical protein
MAAAQMSGVRDAGALRRVGVFGDLDVRGTRAEEDETQEMMAAKHAARICSRRAAADLDHIAQLRARDANALA